jgi:hypothetical protein
MKAGQELAAYRSRHSITVGRDTPTACAIPVFDPTWLKLVHIVDGSDRLVEVVG